MLHGDRDWEFNPELTGSQECHDVQLPELWRQPSVMQVTMCSDLDYGGKPVLRKFKDWSYMATRSHSKQHVMATQP